MDELEEEEELEEELADILNGWLIWIWTDRKEEPLKYSKITVKEPHYAKFKISIQQSKK